MYCSLGEIFAGGIHSADIQYVLPSSFPFSLPRRYRRLLRRISTPLTQVNTVGVMFVTMAISHTVLGKRSGPRLRELALCEAETGFTQPMDHLDFEKDTSS